MARLYAQTGDRDKAAACFKMILQRHTASGGTISSIQEVRQAHLFLAEHFFQQGKHEEARQQARILHESTRSTQEREQATELLHRIEQGMNI